MTCCIFLHKMGCLLHVGHRKERLLRMNEQVRSDDARKSEPSNPTMLFELLTEEIAAIEARSHRPGWTPWAIGGALASLTWLFLAEVEKGVASWHNVFLTFLALSLVVDAVFHLSRHLVPSGGVRPQDDRFSYLDDTLGCDRIFLSTLLLRSMAVLTVSYHIPPVVPGWLLLTTRTYLYLLIVILLMATLLSILHLPFPRNPKTKRWWVNLSVFLLARHWLNCHSRHGVALPIRAGYCDASGMARCAHPRGILGAPRGSM